MNTVRLQPYCVAIDTLKKLGSPLVAGVRLTPAPDLKTMQVTFFVNNVYKDQWLPEPQMIEMVQRVASMVQVPLTYAGHAVVGRAPELFAPYTDVEVFAVWGTTGDDDEYIQSPEIAQGITAIQADKVFLWGWVPGYVLECVNNTVKIKLDRMVYSNNWNGDVIVSVPYDAPWVRIVRKSHAGIATSGEGEVKVRA